MWPKKDGAFSKLTTGKAWKLIPDTKMELIKLLETDLTGLFVFRGQSADCKGVLHLNLAPYGIPWKMISIDGLEDKLEKLKGSSIRNAKTAKGLGAEMSPEAATTTSVNVNSQPDMVAYLSRLIARLAHVPLLDALGLKFDDLRVPLTVVPHDLRISRQEIEERERFRVAMSYDSTPEIRNRVYAFRHSDDWDPTMKPRQILLENAIRNVNKLVILGDPGSGKTEWLRFNARGLARQAVDQLSARSSTGSVPIPVYVSLPDVGHEIASGTVHENLCRIGCIQEDTVLSDVQQFAGAILLAASHAHEISPETISRLWKLMWREESAYSLVLHLDSLDEVRYMRGTLEAALRGFIDETPAKVFITSRTINYTWSLFLPTSGRIYDVKRELQLCPLRPQEVTRFIAAFWKNDASKIQTVNEEIARHPSIEGMIQNPLLATLTFMTYLVNMQDGSQMPTTRCEVYDSVIRGLLGEWSCSLKGQPLNHELIETEYRLLEELAYFTFPDESFSMTKMCDFLWSPDSGYMRSLDQSHPVRKLAGPELADGISTSLCSQGILVQVPGRVVRLCFLHLTFHEFLTAKAISRRDWMNIAQSKCMNPHWHEPLSLLGGVLGKSVNRYIHGLMDSIGDDVLLRHGDLAIRAMCEAKAEDISDAYSKALYTVLFHQMTNSCSPFKELLTQMMLRWGSRAIPALRCLMTTGDAIARSDAIALLAVSGTPAAPLINEFIRSKPDPNDLFLILDMWRQYPASEYVDQLIELLSHPDEIVSHCASFVLALLGESARPQLKAHVQQHIGQPSAGLVLAPCFAGDPDGVPFLAKLLKPTRDAETVTNILIGLAACSSPKVIPLLLQYCEHKDPAIVCVALKGLANYVAEMPKAPPVIARLVTHPNVELAIKALDLMNRMPFELSKDIIMAALEDAREFVHAKATIILWTKGVEGIEDHILWLISKASKEAWKAIVIDIPETLPHISDALAKAKAYGENLIGSAAKLTPEFMAILRELNSRVECLNIKAGSPTVDELVNALTSESLRTATLRRLQDKGRIQDVSAIIRCLHSSIVYDRIAALCALQRIAQRHNALIPWSECQDEEICEYLKALRADIHTSNALLSP
jgi:HEAT repeat protein